MPVYEYQCQNCGHKIERLQSIHDSSYTLCPNCGKNKLRKCVSLSSFRLKGDGWYVTDRKSKDAPPAQLLKNGEKVQDERGQVESETKKTGEAIHSIQNGCACKDCKCGSKKEVSNQ
jgi:putative FmdB family regulatory protein